MKLGEHRVAGQVQAANLDRERAMSSNSDLDLPPGVGRVGQAEDGEMDAVGRVEVVTRLDAVEPGRGLKRLMSSQLAANATRAAVTSGRRGAP